MTGQSRQFNLIKIHSMISCSAYGDMKIFMIALRPNKKHSPVSKKDIMV